jgi:ribonuclease Z
MTTYVRILAVPTSHSSPTVVLVSDLTRLVFNCGEGTQRLCVEHKVRLSKVAGIFVTHNGPEAICGLPGAAISDLSWPVALCFD